MKKYDYMKKANIKEKKLKELIDFTKSTYDDSVLSEKIEFFVKQEKININGSDELGNTLLTLCATRKNYLSVKKLLILGANPNICSVYLSYPLKWAVEDTKSNIEQIKNKQIIMVQDLIDNGADIFINELEVFKLAFRSNCIEIVNILFAKIKTENEFKKIEDALKQVIDENEELDINHYRKIDSIFCDNITNLLKKYKMKIELESELESKPINQKNNKI